jgi:hypothetical protein
MDVEHFRVGLIGQSLIANGVHQMRLAQTHTTINEQWVVELTRNGGHVHGRCTSHSVGGTFNQRLKGKSRIEA